MLSERQADLLRLLVGDYIASASSLSSSGLVKAHGLPFSSATVRNEFAELEAAGYVFRPHTSAGVIPTERGYRFYVETLKTNLDLPADQRWTIRHQFHQVEREEDRWLRLAAATLAHVATALAMVTPPRAAVSRLRAVEIVPLEEARALVIVVLQGGQLHRALIFLPEAFPPEEFEHAGHRLTAAHTGRTRAAIARTMPSESSLDAQALNAVLSLMAQADAEMEDAPYLYGFTQVLRQPEFTDSGLIRGLLEAVDAGRLVSALRPSDLSFGELRVTIGEEHAQDFLRPYGVVLAVYGNEGEGRGMVAVLGPMRMAYGTAIPSVRYLAQILTELAEETAPTHHRNE